MSVDLPELWQWAEFYCPWCYIAAVRLQRVAPEYAGRLRLRERAFPLEVYGGGPPDRRELELEIWLAALQEPEAIFKPFKAAWPKTTLPAFDGAWSAAQEGEQVGRGFDLAIRKAFFAEGADIGDPGVILELARQLPLDLDAFKARIRSGEARRAVLAEGHLGKASFRVRGTPTIMSSTGKRFQHPMAYPKIKDGRIESVGRLPCFGTGCDDMIRAIFEETLAETS